MVLAWIISLGRFVCYVAEEKAFTLWKAGAKSANHLVLHRLIALALLKRLFRETVRLGQPS